MSNIEAETVDVFVTSPPYWNFKDYGHQGQIGIGSYERYLSRMDVVWQECYRLAKPDAVLALNIGNRRHKGVFTRSGWTSQSA